MKRKDRIISRLMDIRKSAIELLYPDDVAVDLVRRERISREIIHNLHLIQDALKISLDDIESYEWKKEKGLLK